MNSELDHMPHTRIFCSVYVYIYIYIYIYICTDYPTYQSKSVADTLRKTLEWKQTHFTTSSSYFCLESTTTPPPPPPPPPTTTTTTTTTLTVMTLVMYLLTLNSLSRLLAFDVSSLPAEK